tara:strand:- start:166 stop:909 length:744 start_codon:yes stop_codon:yes gene_type:complete
MESKLQELKKQGYNPLTNDPDLVLSVETLKLIGATNIWELGCGSGDWSICVDKMVQPGLSQYHLVDNFEFSNLHPDIVDYLGYYWPKDEKDIKKHLSEAELDYVFYNIDIANLPDPDDLIDCVRLDTAYETSETIQWCVDNLSENGIIQCADIKINKSFQKTMLMTEQVLIGSIEPVWLGEGEGVWCRKGKGHHIREKLFNNTDLQEYFGELKWNEFTLMDKKYEYLRARLKQTRYAKVRKELTQKL